MSFSEHDSSHGSTGPGYGAGFGDGEGAASGESAAASGLESLRAGLAPEIARRVSSIFDAVEHEAEGLRAEAREEARRYYADAQRRADDLVRRRQQRIGELSDELIAKAEAVVSRLDSAAPVREGFESLVRALGDAAERLSGEISEGGTPPTEIGVPPAGQVSAGGASGGPGAAPQSQPQPQRPAPPSGPPRFAGGTAETVAPGLSDPDGARRGAIEMAAAGATRAEVRERIEPQAGPEATAAILDSIFGAAGDDERVPWTAFGG
jgi:vacuolar-type H+-ATPase subunit H